MSYETRAFVFLVILAVVAVLTVVWAFSKGRLSSTLWLFYYVDRLLLGLLWRMPYPRRQIPSDMGAILICNHRSSVDPCLVQAIIGKRVCHWMGAQIYSGSPFVVWAFKHLEIIPVRKTGNDTSPIKSAIRMARKGELVGIFPEGGINRSEDFMLPIRPGLVMIALKARVPIIPCYLEGSPYQDNYLKSLMTPSRVIVKMGPPIDLSDYYGRRLDKTETDWLTVYCIQQIAKLAGKPDYQPVIAGRQWKDWADSEM